MFILKDAYYYNGEDFENCNLLIKDNKVIKVEDISGYKVIDCKNKLVTHAFIDPHVHLREPGYTHKEDIKTGTLSALYGGYYLVYAMPNTNPIMDHQALINKFNDKDGHTLKRTFSAINKNFTGELVNVKETSIIGYSNDGCGCDSKSLDELQNKTKKIISMHLEAQNYKDFPQREYKMLEEHLKILKPTTKYNVCHISSAITLEMIKKAKEAGYNITCEVTPHHLLLDQSMIKNTNYKMNPPLLNKTDVEALVDGLNKGVIDMIATDHAPHTDIEKNVEYNDAPNGIIGLEFSFSLLYTKLVLTNKVKLATLLDAMSYNPARIFCEDITKANLTIIDLEEKFIIKDLKSKSSNTPFLNEEVYAKIKAVIINEEIRWI